MEAPTPVSLLSPFQQMIERFWYAPVTTWSRLFNPQFIFNYNPEDEDIERHVLGRVGSYGSQLGTLIDAIDVLRHRLPDDLDPLEQSSIEEFDRLRDEAERAKADFRGLDPAQLIRRLAELKDRDPEGFEQVRAAFAN
jgi:hypothetical protein